AIGKDLISILDEIENKLDIEYVEMGRFEANKFGRYPSHSEIPNLGFTDWGSWSGLDHHYLITPVEAHLAVEEITLKGGGSVYLIDQKNNPASIELTTGGIFTQKEKVIIAGRIATISRDSRSVELFKLLSSGIARTFKKLDAYYVGPNAFESLNRGWRL